ncbi:MAG: cytochrome c biogenesis protein ResB [Desulfobacteraceae bacterium]|nr:cytochrome c biogenesis protein ResB [Desulfobacteraceae bacterium]MCF8093855.1 cytochrome c biogenesis protein ResB [Desulfobacteraceae bacterium]
MKTKNKNGTAIERIWHFFASVRLSVVLLLTLAATSIIGTVIPQNADPAAYERKFGQPVYTVLESLNMFDMYHSWWFRLLLCVLIVNIIVCSIQRLKSTWRIIFPKTPAYQPERFRKSAGRVQWQAAGASAEALKKMFEPYMRKHFRNIKVENPPENQGIMIFGEKGRWTRLGVYAVHFSVLLLMLGGLIGSIFGFEGYVNIPAGETRQAFSLKNSNQTQKFGFAIRCDDFNVSHYPSGRPKEYRSDIAIIDNGKVAVTHKLRVNAPLTYKGITIFQSSYGKTPSGSFNVVFTDNEDGTRITKKAAIGETVDLPEGSGELIIRDYSNSFSLRGHNMGPSFLGMLKPESGQPRPLLLPVNHPSFDKMRGGQYQISVKDVEFIQYTGLQIARDPGVPVVYTGFIIMIAGCYVTFFMFHRKICIELQPEDNGARILVAGISQRNRTGTKNAVKRLAQKLDRMARQTGKIS